MNKNSNFGWKWKARHTVHRHRRDKWLFRIGAFEKSINVPSIKLIVKFLVHTLWYIYINDLQWMKNYIVRFTYWIVKDWWNERGIKKRHKKTECGKRKKQQQQQQKIDVIFLQRLFIMRHVTDHKLLRKCLMHTFARSFSRT